MRIVKMPLDHMPHSCAVTGRQDGELIDFGCNIPSFNPRVYLKREIVEQAGKLIGMVPEADHAKALAAVAATQTRIAQMGEEIEELRTTVEAMRRVEGAVA